MKKIVVYIVLACTMMMLTSCEKQAELSAVKAIEMEDSVDSSAESSRQDFIEEVSKENYSEVPDEAVDLFNTVSQISKKIFCDADGKWMYGYKGVEKIYDQDCYVFSVYTENDDSSDKIGIVAIAEISKKVYVLNEATGAFEKAEYTDETKNCWAYASAS